MDSLPYELIRLIIDHIDVSDIFNLVMVNKKISKIRDDKSFWMMKIKKLFPKIDDNDYKMDDEGKKYLQTRGDIKVYYVDETDLCIKLNEYKRIMLKNLFDKNRKIVNKRKRSYYDDLCLLDPNRSPIYYYDFGSGGFIIPDVAISYRNITTFKVGYGMVQTKIYSKESINKFIKREYNEEMYLDMKTYINDGYIEICDNLMDHINVRDAEYLGIMEHYQDKL